MSKRLCPYYPPLLSSIASFSRRRTYKSAATTEHLERDAPVVAPAPGAFIAGIKEDLQTCHGKAER